MLPRCNTHAPCHRPEIQNQSPAARRGPQKWVETHFPCPKGPEAHRSLVSSQHGTISREETL